MSEKKILGIYKITSPTNRIYIGYTTNKKSRWDRYKRLICKDQPLIYNSLKKHGVENHVFSMIHIFNKDGLTELEVVKELKRLEIYYIDYFKSFSDDSKFGMNLTRGGDGGEVSEESRKKISDYHKGRKSSEEAKKKISESKIGKKRSVESKKKQSDSNLGEKNHFFGKKHNLETIKKMSGENHHLFGKKLSEESIRKQKETKKRIREERLMSGYVPKKRVTSEETKQKLSLILKGKKRNKETKEKMRKSKTGEKNPMFGNKRSEELKQRQRIAMIGRKNSEESILKMKETKRRIREEKLMMIF